MRGRLRLLLVVWLAAWPARAAGQDEKPRTGEPGVPTRSAVVDVRTLPDTPPTRPEPAIGGLIHVPLRRPPDSMRPVPPGLRAPAAPAAEREVLPLGPSPALTESFLAQPDSFTHIPPDTHGAVGPNHLMVSLNSQLRFQTRSGGLITSKSLNTFWTGVNGGGGTFDPKTLYDPYANRWISVACDDARSASSAILVGASQTGDPTGSWYQFAIDADATDTVWADFPSVGFNSKWIVVQLNMFTFAGSYVRSNIYVFDRAALYGGTASFNMIPDTMGFTQAPAVTYDMAQSDLFMVEEWNGGAGALRLTKISGPVSTPAYSEVSMPIGPAWFGAPPVSNHAPQSGSVERIATNDARIQNVVYRNGKLWATHTVFLPRPGPVERASVQWWQLSTAGGVLQNGRIDDASSANYYAFPSIAVNKLDDALLGFSCFSASRFASACYAFRKAGDVPNTFQDVATLKEGLASYYKTFFPPNTVNRWGDYSATQVDPVNDVDLWTIQEYADSPANLWSTWWGHLALPPNVTIDDVSVTEGNSGTVNARFTISLSFPATQLVEVDWVAANGSATIADSDFQTASGRASFPAGAVTQFVDVPVVGDFKLEPNETFVVDLSNPLFGVITDAQGQGTIVDDDGVPRMSIDDVRVVEGNAGTANAIFTVTLSNPSAATAQASWSTADGTAVAPDDYAASSGTVSFTPGTTSQTLIVLVQGDFLAEPKETFTVNLTSPTGAVLGESRGVGTILDDDGPTNPGVSAFTIVSDGGAAALTGRNRLQWVNPVGGSPIETRIRYNKGSGCTAPTVSGGPSFDVITLLPPLGAPGETRSFDHTGLDLDTSYCYTIWAIHTGSVASPGLSGIGRPFDATGRVKWKYSTGTGTTGVAPPTIALEGVLAVDNSGDVHAMARSASGGAWPAPPWSPADLGSPSQARNPWVPLGLGPRLYLTTQDGRAHAVDSTSGATTWSTSLSPPALTGAPSGVFTAFGGEHDAIFVGTSAANNNVFHALHPATGAPLGSFGVPPGIGPILGMAVVDYTRAPQNRVYFASRQGSASETLWCLNLGPPGPVAFTLRWKVALGNISGSPVLRNDRIYVGTDAGEVKSVRADDGLDVRTIDLGDGPVRGFVFPDRGSNDLYASTSNKVWRLTDPGTGTALTVLWLGGVSVPNPSPPLLRPGATHLYVGGGDGKLYQLTLPGGALTSIALDYDPLTFVVGAPSYDTGYGLVHVGSERGTFYAVEVPLP